MAFIYIIIIVIACVILVKSAHWIIKSLIYFAQYLHIPEFVVAFILAGLVTSLPEFFVGISAAITKTPILSLSNIFGSNIANVTLILGLTVILTRGLTLKSKTIQRNIFYTSLLLIYPILLTLDGVLSRVDGLGLLVLFTLYILILFHQSQDFTKKFERALRKNLIKNLIIFVISITFLLTSSHIIVLMSKLLAMELNISLFLVGLFLIAIGTSLPELIFGIEAAQKKHKDMIFGNILGSIAVNSTAVLGITAIICPITINDIGLLITTAIFMFGVYLLFAFFSYSKRKLSWQEGFILLFLYVAFIIIQFLVK